MMELHHFDGPCQRRSDDTTSLEPAFILQYCRAYVRLEVAAFMLLSARRL